MSMTTVRFRQHLLLLLLFAGCGGGGSNTDVLPDSGLDAQLDSGLDALPDSGLDSGPDALPDSGPDALPDLGPDAILDLGSDSDTGPHLLFASGFENDVYLEAPGELEEYWEDYQFIRGTDSETGFTWPIDILGSSNSGLHFVDYDDYQALYNEIQTVTGHDGTPTRALYNVEYYDLGVTQCPYEILDIRDGTEDLYVRYWIKMDAESLMQESQWRALFEWKTKDYAEGSGFRLIAYVYTDRHGSPYWHWQGDANPEHALWEIDNTEIPVSPGEWFLTEFYWHWSEGDDGRALWRVNGEVVGDHHGPTTRNSKPIDFIMLTQLYGDVNPKHQWIDDIEIWDGLPGEQ